MACLSKFSFFFKTYYHFLLIIWSTYGNAFVVFNRWNCSMVFFFKKSVAEYNLSKSTYTNLASWILLFSKYIYNLCIRTFWLNLTGFHLSEINRLKMKHYYDYFICKPYRTRHRQYSVEWRKVISVFNISGKTANTNVRWAFCRFLRL